MGIRVETIEDPGGDSWGSVGDNRGSGWRQLGIRVETIDDPG